MQATIVRRLAYLLCVFSTVDINTAVAEIAAQETTPPVLAGHRVTKENLTGQADSVRAIAQTPCVPLKRVDSGLVKAAIKESGHYCLTEDLHARFDMADHAAEGSMIIVRASNVVLDLQGHTLGRGRLLKNPGGYGISIADPSHYAGGVGKARDIIIRNGVLQDFNVGIGYGRWDVAQDTPTFSPQTNTYHFPANNITLENITFKNNKKDFEIHVPDEPKK